MQTFRKLPTTAPNAAATATAGILVMLTAAAPGRAALPGVARAATFATIAPCRRPRSRTVGQPDPAARREGHLRGSATASRSDAAPTARQRSEPPAAVDRPRGRPAMR